MRIVKSIVILSLIATAACSGDKSPQVPASVVNIPNSATGNNSPGELPVITFKTLEHDFGKVIQGEVVTYAFKFTNTGKSDLIIANISAACGCTVGKYPKQPIKAGEESVIDVSFDSNGRQGFQNKTLLVAANTQPSSTTLTISAMVLIPEKE